MSKRVIISESQYSRLFLNEQQLDNRLSKPLSPYVRAQEQWARLGADNPKTGRNIIPDNTVKYYKDLYDQGIENVNKTVGEKPVDWYSSPEAINIGMDSNRPSNFNQNWQSEPTKWEERKSSEVEKTVDKSYYDIIELNKNIKSQPKLIPQYCKKPNVISNEMDWICGTGECDEVSDYRWNELKKKRDKYDGEFGWYFSNPKTGRKYGYCLKYSVNVGETPFKHCNTEALKGVWVYKFESGYHCGCYEMDNQKYLTNTGTHSTNVILGLNQKLRDYEISKQPGFLDSVTQWAGGCFEDYHCVLDILSIAALAVPGVGVFVSSGIDVINAAAYGIEGALTKGVDRDAAWVAGGLTLFGGIAGGWSKTAKYLKVGKNNPKIFNYTNDVIKRIEKELPGVVKLGKIDNVVDIKKLENIYAETANIYKLTNKEILQSHNILKLLSSIDPKTAKLYSQALTEIESKVGRTTLADVFKNKSWKKALEKNNGDIATTLKKFMNRPDYKVVLIQLGAFIGVQKALEIPSVSKWVGEAISDVKNLVHSTPKNLVESYGYPWETTRDIFMSDKSIGENTLLKSAWQAGWRPWSDDISNFKEPTEKDTLISVEWLMKPKNEKYRTKKFKEVMSSYDERKKNILYSVSPENFEDRKEGVRYVDNVDNPEKLVGIMNSEVTIADIKELENGLGL